MQNSNEYIRASFERGQFDSVRYACLERLKHDRTEAQVWLTLGQAMIGLKRGRMAELCFRRSILFDPYSTWESEMSRQARSVGQGRDDNKVLQVLEVPRVTVAATILTRNSSRTIRPCLEALQGAVDEIIVVDTGSTDNTVEIVESFGIEVHHFEWRDDFSAARNYAQSFVSSEWTIAIDSDEILYREDKDSLRIVAGIINTKPFVVQALQMNKLNETVTPAPIIRMFKASECEWIFPIHEQIARKHSVNNGEGLNTLTLRIRLLHDGYDLSVVDLTEKINRNIDILRNVARADPDNAINNFFLGRDLASSGQYDEAIIYLEKAHEHGKQIEGFQFLPDICSTLYGTYSPLGRQEDAKSAAQRLTQDHPEHPNGWYYYGIAIANSSPFDIQAAIEMFTMAKNTGTIYRGHSNFDHEIGTWKADFMLGQLAQRSGDLHKAQTLLREVLRVVPNNVDASNRLQEIERQIK